MLVATLFGIVFIFTDMTVVYVLTRGDTAEIHPCWRVGHSSKDLGGALAGYRISVPRAFNHSTDAQTGLRRRLLTMFRKIAA
jgi:hypothetical protein